jgi:hypothetical protein
MYSLAKKVARYQRKHAGRAGVVYDEVALATTTRLILSVSPFDCPL